MAVKTTSETSVNPYFDASRPQVIEDVDTLLSLNVQKGYYAPGDQTPVDDIRSLYHSPYLTSGIFRGQLRDWPLIPKGFRGLVEPAEEKPLTPVIRSFQWSLATHKFREFCSRAEGQNPAFPRASVDRMAIAQHFGVPTPLLDWTQSIFPAVFCAVRDVFNDPEFETSLRVFVYHVIDERLLRSGLPEEGDLADVGESAFIKPFAIDRRIERQRGVFTFHPYPSHRPRRIPASVYILEWPLIARLLRLMKGFGFTEDYYFPDYAGIAHAVMSGTSL